MAKITTSIIIATLNRPNDIRTCLRSISSQTVPPDEIIIVDDGDTDKTRDIVTELEMDNCIIISGDSGGLPASRNIGIEHASGDILCFIDDDVVLPITWLEDILQTYDDYEAAGVGGLVVNQMKSDVSKGNIQSLSYRSLMAIRKVFFYNRIGDIGPCGYLYLPHTVASVGIKQVDSLQGCSMTFRKEVFSTESFDEWYGKGGSAPCEEIDFCSRLTNNDNKLLFNPHAVTIHNRSTAGGGRSKLKNREFRGLRNHARFTVKNFGVGSPSFFLLLFISIFLSILSLSLEPVEKFAEGINGEN